ncbi:MAG: hypothetical protein HOP08_05300 [Cyclobacteriaceae bacterium]|nr:hypothetical protein [Cyclobacteriaceae bacterium]
MISRLRRILTISLLLLFSLENVANAVITTTFEKYSPSEQVSTKKENVTFFSVLIEENENEEKSDKSHAYLSEIPSISSSYSRFVQLNKITPQAFLSPISANGHRILMLTGRLRI